MGKYKEFKVVGYVIIEYILECFYDFQFMIILLNRNELIYCIGNI